MKMVAGRNRSPSSSEPREYLLLEGVQPEADLVEDVDHLHLGLILLHVFHSLAGELLTQAAEPPAHLVFFKLVCFQSIDGLCNW